MRNYYFIPVSRANFRRMPNKSKMQSKGILEMGRIKRIDGNTDAVEIRTG